MSSYTAGLTVRSLNMSLATKEQFVNVLNFARLFFLALEPFASELQ